MEISAGPAHPSHHSEEYNTERIAQAVAALLAPKIAALVEKAVHAGMQHIQKELREHASQLNKAEQRLSKTEDELYQAQATEQIQDKTNQYIIQKLEDLENRSRRCNLPFVGVPESLQVFAITEFCASHIPEALSLPAPCIVEWTHRWGSLRRPHIPPPNHRQVF